MALEAGLILLVIFVALMLLSVPVSMAIVISSFFTITILLTPQFGLFISAQRLTSGMDSFTLLAIPFFVLSGLIMSKGGIAGRLVDCALVFVGRIPGSLIHTNVVGNAMFGSISGSSVAAAAAIGGVMSPLQKKAGYDPTFSAAANIASAPMGQLIPPTAAFIVYSLASGGASVSALFMAGIIPGVLWGIACMVVGYIFAKKNNYPTVVERPTFRMVLKAFFNAFPSLLLLVIILGGITAGVFTPTEAAGIAVAYTFILSVFIYRSIKLSEIPTILIETVIMTSVIMLIVGASSVMSFLMSFTGIPNAISGLIFGISDNMFVLLLIMNIFLLLVGTFMDMAPALLIFTPIFLPIMTNVGVDPVHFGVIMVMNLAVGTITPPVGSVLFVGCSITELDIGSVVKRLLPFYVAIVVALLLVTYIPAFSTWLPTVLNLME